MCIDLYIDNINRRYKHGNSTEHTFRGDLQQLIESIISISQYPFSATFAHNSLSYL